MDLRLVCCFLGAALLAVGSATTYPPRNTGSDTKEGATTLPPPREGKPGDNGPANSPFGNYTMDNNTMDNNTMGNDTMGNSTMANETSPPPTGGSNQQGSGGDRSGGGQPPPPTTAPAGRTDGEQPPPPTTAPGGRTGGGEQPPPPTTAPGGRTGGGEQPAPPPTTAPGGRTGGEQPAPPPTTAPGGGTGKGENPPTTRSGPGQQPGETTMPSRNLEDELLKMQTLLQKTLQALNTSNVQNLRRMSATLSYLNDAQKVTLRNLTSGTGSVTPDSLAFLSRYPDVLRFLKTTALSQMNTLSAELKKPICKAAASVPAIFKKVSPYLTCGPVLTTESLDPVVKRQLADTILKKTEGSAPLSADDWKQLGTTYADALRPTDLTRMPADFAAQNLGTMAKMMDENEDPAVRVGLVEKVKAAVALSAMTSDQVRDLAPSIFAFTPSDIGAIPDSAVKDSLSALAAESNKLNNAQRATIGEKALKALPQNRTTWSKEMYASVGKMMVNSKKFMKNLRNNDFKKMYLSEPAFVSRDETEARSIWKNAKKIPEFQNMTGLTKDTLEEFAPAVAGLPPTSIGKIRPHVLVESVKAGVLSNISMATESAKELGRQLDGGFSNDTPPADLVAKLGGNVKGMPSGLVSRLPTAAFSMPETVAVLAKNADKMSRSTQQAFVSKMSVSSTNLCKLGKMGRLMTSDKMSSLTGQDVYTAISQEESCDLDLHDSQSGELFEKLKMVKGRPTADNFNYTAAVLGKMGSLMSGMTLEDWSSVPTDSKLLNFVRSLASQEHINLAVASKVTKALSVLYNLASAPNATEDDLQTIGGGLLQHLDVATLQRLGSDKCVKVVSLIGARKDLDLDVEKLGKIAVNYGLNFCLGKASGDITSREVKILGYLVWFLDEPAAERLDKSAMEASSEVLQESPTFSRKMRKVLKKRALAALQKKSVSEITSFVDMAIYGTLLAVECGSEFSSISQEALADAMPYLVKKMEKQREMRMERDKVGRQQEVSSGERQKGDDDDKCAVRAMLAASVAVQFRRRRRSTTAPTCDDIKSMGSLASSMTTAQLSALAEQDFRDCAFTLGQVSDWSTEQKAALASKAKTVWGALSSWTAAHVESVGTMGQGLTSSEMGQLTLHNDGMSALGQLLGWSLEQLEAGWARWFASQKSSTHGQVTGSDLIILGEFACGPSVSDIASLTTQAFGVAARSLGELKSCPQDKLEAFAAKAKAHYGNTVAQWSQAILDALRIIMAGLSGSDLSTLTQNQIPRLTTDTIAAIPAKNFMSITPAQIRLMTPVQVKAVTSAQYKAAPPALQEALRDNGYSTSVDDNGAGVTRLSGLLMLFTLLLLAL